MRDDLRIRIIVLESNGHLADYGMEHSLDDFAGHLPAGGDEILDPGVTVGLDRRKYQNRRIWAVQRRVFNWKDNPGYVALIVTEREAKWEEEAII